MFYLNWKNIDLEQPTCLFQSKNHAIYWLGLSEESAFRCNVYLIVDEGAAWMVDPGGSYGFAQIQKRTRQIIALEQLNGLIICHQDPDVCASMKNWLELIPTLKIYTTPRTHVLLPHYGIQHYDFYDVTENPILTLPSKTTLTFIESPFLHFPGAFTTFDSTAECLFSGDIWAALDIDWSLTVTEKDFQSHAKNMDLFHKEYMASNVATRGFIRKLEPYRIQAIFPQHGSIIPTEFVPQALSYLKNLRCGIDLIYGDLID